MASAKATFGKSRQVEALLEQYRAEQVQKLVENKYTAWTVNTKLSKLRTFIKWCVKKHHLEHEPANLSDVCASFATRKSGKPLTIEQVRSLWEHANQRMKAWIAVSLPYLAASARCHSDRSVAKAVGTICLCEYRTAFQPLQWAAGRHLRQVIDHGHQAVVHTDEDEAGPARIEWLDLHQQTTRTLLTVDRALEQLPVALQDSQARYIFHHPVVNHDQSRMFCKLMKIDTNDRPKFGAFYTMDLRSDTIQCLGDRISGHPFWMTDGQYILNIKHPHDGSENRHLVRVNADTGKDDRIIDLPIEGPGHPAQSPDGQWIVTDAFTDNGLESPIYLINLNTGVAREILRLNHLFRPTDHQGGPSPITRGQPHPVWSPCGSKILVNYNHAGSHFGLLLLEAMF